MKENHPYRDLVGEIAKYRQINSCTNREIGKLAHLSRAKVSAFIAGTRVDDDTARSIARAIKYDTLAQNGKCH